MTDYSWVDQPEQAGVRDLLDAVSAVDGRPSLPDDGSLPGEFRGGDQLLAVRDGVVVGYVGLNTAGDAFGRLVAELVVRPADRRGGIGAELATRLLAHVGVAADAEPGDTLRVWAHGDQQAAATLAHRLGFRRAREMRRLRMPLTDAVAEPELPTGIRLRAFVPGQDEDAVIEVNRLAFAWHPEQGAMSADDLRSDEAESWFDAAGFLLAVTPEDRVVGFHWTKVHPNVDGSPMGEVYVVGVHPDAQGGGLGKALTLAGLAYLRDRRGVDRVMLYVESDNQPALAVYDKLGFTIWDADVQYAR
ncbi:MAG TPA: mycothiol synthase [Pseudonocardiaceae bacterium]|nr:mycothiol synthase [Pseudonocardiaceae bacterium]